MSHTINLMVEKLMSLYNPVTPKQNQNMLKNKNRVQTHPSFLFPERDEQKCNQFDLIEIFRQGRRPNPPFLPLCSHP